MFHADPLRQLLRPWAPRRCIPALAALLVSAPAWGTGAPFPRTPPSPSHTVVPRFPPPNTRTAPARQEPLAILYRELNPVRHPFMSHWHHATVREMSGPSASPWYRDTATALDVRWRLAEVSPTAMHIDRDTRDRAVDMALTGALTGWNATVSHTLRHSPELVPVHAALRSALHPSLHIRSTANGSATVSSDRAGDQNQRTAFAQIQQGAAVDTTGAHPTASSSPSVRTGSAVSLIRIPDRTDIQRAGAPLSPLSPGLSSWVDLRHVVFDAARVQTRITQNPERRRFRPSARWAAAIRQDLMPSWSMLAEVQGTPELLRPARNVVALEHHLARWGKPAWAVRLSAQQEMRPDLVNAPFDGSLHGPVEQRLMLNARTNLAWHVPLDPDRWPLGNRPGAPGPLVPSLLPTGPGHPIPLEQSPAERYCAATSDGDGVADR